MESRVRDSMRSVPELLKDLRDETTTLLRQEVALARMEMSDKAARVGRNLASLAVGALVLFAGFLVLLWAATAGLAAGLRALDPGLAPHTAWLAPLVVGALVLVVGLVLVSRAARTLKRTSVVPEKTVQTLKEDKEWLAKKAA